MRLGDEPPELTAMNLALASSQGPVVLAAGNQPVPQDVERLGLPTCRSASMSESILQGAETIGTDAVIIVAGRSVPDIVECEDVLNDHGDEVEFVIGRRAAAGPLSGAAANSDSFDDTLRDRSRFAGLLIPEPDGTIVSTRLLTSYPIGVDQSMGSWLRSLSSSGVRGAAVDNSLSQFVAPVHAEDSWRLQRARRRALADDLKSAMTAGIPRQSKLAALFLARELSVVPATLWALTPIALSDRGAHGGGPGLAFLVLLALAAARWALARLATGAPLRLAGDLRRWIQRLPGSAYVLATLVRPNRDPSPRTPVARPVVACFLIATVVFGLGVLKSAGTGRPDAALLVLAQLAAIGLWITGVRALVDRSWRRRTHRVPVDLEIGLDGVPGRAFDGSPFGLGATVGRSWPKAELGDRVNMTATLSDGRHVTTTAIVRRIASVDDGWELGLAMDLGHEDLAQWSVELHRWARGDCVSRDSAHPHEPVGQLGDKVRSASRVAFGTVAAAAAILVGTVAMGFRPLTIQSGSMVPALDVGDVVVNRTVSSTEVGVGDVITVEFDGTDRVTHRVIESIRMGDEVQITTKGDANDSGEVWLLPSDSAVGLRWFTIPSVGRPWTSLRTVGASGLFQLGVFAAVLAALYRVLSRRRRNTDLHPKFGA